MRLRQSLRLNWTNHSAIQFNELLNTMSDVIQKWKTDCPEDQKKSGERPRDTEEGRSAELRRNSLMARTVGQLMASLTTGIQKCQIKPT